jgi:hypothetical protein
VTARHLLVLLFFTLPCVLPLLAASAPPSAVEASTGKDTDLPPVGFT